MFEVKSVAYHAWFKEDFDPVAQQRAIESAKSLNSNTLTIGWAVPIDRHTGELTDKAVSSEFSGVEWLGTSTAAMVELARMAERAGLNTIFKPYFLDSRTAHNIGGFTEEWADTNASAVKDTIGSYLKALAPQASAAGVDSIVIGTEQSALQTPEYAGWWGSTIAEMRSQFVGEIGYAAVYFPFHKGSIDVRDIAFAASLDYVGVDMYLPVTTQGTVTYEQALNAWSHNKSSYWPWANSDIREINVIDDLRGISELYGKPVMFTETGYPSSVTAASNPSQLSAPDPILQSILTRAEFDALTRTDPSWFKGVMFFTPGGAEQMEWYKPDQDSGWGLKGKPAEDVVRLYFSDVANDGVVSSHILHNGVDAIYYKALNPDVALAGVDPETHFKSDGWKEGRDPNALFDTGWYLAQNPDVAAAGMNPYEHYLSYGWQEGRSPSRLFSVNTYLEHNPDVAAAGIEPLTHWLNFGAHEGRDLFYL